jgi:hypothetical protein
MSSRYELPKIGIDDCITLQTLELQRFEVMFERSEAVMICGVIMIVAADNNGSEKLPRRMKIKRQNEVTFGSTEQRIE